MRLTYLGEKRAVNGFWERIERIGRAPAEIVLDGPASHTCILAAEHAVAFGNPFNRPHNPLTVQACHIELPLPHSQKQSEAGPRKRRSVGHDRASIPRLDRDRRHYGVLANPTSGLDRARAAGRAGPFVPA